MGIPQLFQVKSKQKKRLTRLYNNEIGLEGWREATQCTGIFGHTDIHVIYCEMHEALVR